MITTLVLIASLSIADHSGNPDYIQACQQDPQVRQWVDTDIKMRRFQNDVRMIRAMDYIAKQQQRYASRALYSQFLLDEMIKAEESYFSSLLVIQRNEVRIRNGKIKATLDEKVNFCKGVIQAEVSYYHHLDAKRHYIER